MKKQLSKAGKKQKEEKTMIMKDDDVIANSINNEYDGSIEDRKASASESDDDENESDKELQIALQEGLLKTDALNYVVEKKRPLINKKDELREKLKLFTKNLPWLESLHVDVENQTSNNVNVHDDFQRELIFYKQAEKAARVAVPRLLKMGVKVFRPKDYYAEMAKTDDHMQKVLENRQNEKRKFMQAVKKHRKGMKVELEQMLENAKNLREDEDADDDYAFKNANSKQGKANKFGRLGPKISRAARNRRFGFGGQKKRSKRNTKESFSDVGMSRPKGMKSMNQRSKLRAGRR